MFSLGRSWTLVWTKGRSAGAILVCLALLLTSCGGGGGGGSSATSSSPGSSETSSATGVTPTVTPTPLTALKLFFQFSSTAKKVASASTGLPAATATLVVHIEDPATGRDMVAPTRVPRTSGDTQSITIVGVPPGSYLVVVVALDSTDATLGFFTESTTVAEAVVNTVTVASTVVLTSIVITPEAASVRLGSSRAFTATGTFSDQSTANLTAAVSWATSDRAVATIADEALDKGVVTPVAVGSTTVTATTSGVTATSRLRVVAEDAPIESTGTLPGAPSSPVASVQGLGPGEVDISWQPPATDGGSPISGYWVDYTTSSGTWGGGLGTGSQQTSFHFTNLPPGDTFSFSVAALNGVGQGPSSDVASIVIKKDVGDLPGAPQSAVATVSGLPARHVLVSWTPPASDGGSALIGYWLNYRTSSGSWGGGMGMGPQQTSYEFTSLPPGETLSFSVAAQNGVGTGPETAGNSVVVPADVGEVPTAPTSASAVAGTLPRHVTLRWTPPASDGGSALTGYWVSYGTASGTWGGAMVMGPQQTSFEFTNLPPGDTVWFSVAAENGVGRGPATDGNRVVVP